MFPTILKNNTKEFIQNISIVILHYRTPQLLKKCLFSILKFYPEIEKKILVIDNFSQDNTIQLLEKKFPEIQILASTYNSGFARGINWGLENVKTKYVLTLNPDIIIKPGSLEKMYSFMEKQPNIVLIGPKLINPDGTIQDSCRRFMHLMMIFYRRTKLGSLPFIKQKVADFLMKNADHQKIQPVDWIFGAAMFVRMSAIQKVGSLDERYFMYFEDMDWCRRFWESGFKVYYFPKAEFIHYHLRMSAEKNGLSALFNKLGRIHLASALKYFWKFKCRKLPVINFKNIR